MKPVVPDVSLWAQLVEMFDFLGGIQAVVLLSCVAGIALAALAWAAGLALGVRGLSSRGKFGVLVALAAAFCVAALPDLMGWVMDVFS